MDHEQLEETVAAYALGALDQAGRAEVERRLLEHLAGCASCRALFNDLREVTADLALAAAPHAVRPEVEERILDGIRERRPGAERTSRSRSPGRSAFGRIAVAAAAAALVALGAWNVQLASRVNDATDRASSVAAAVSLMSAPDARATMLNGEAGTLVFVARPGEAVLVGHDVPAPSRGNVLQLWLMRVGVPTSAGAFRPTDGVVVLRVPLEAGAFDAVAVTVEKAPRASRPTRPPIYSATIRA